MRDPHYTEYFGIEATGHRIGLASCKRCGVAVILGDPDFDAAQKHFEWHQAQDAPKDIRPPRIRG